MLCVLQVAQRPGCGVLAPQRVPARCSARHAALTEWICHMMSGCCNMSTAPAHCLPQGREVLKDGRTHRSLDQLEAETGLLQRMHGRERCRGVAGGLRTAGGAGESHALLLHGRRRRRELGAEQVWQLRPAPLAARVRIQKKCKSSCLIDVMCIAGRMVDQSTTSLVCTADNIGVPHVLCSSDFILVTPQSA